MAGNMLVLGGSVFVGRHLVELLRTEGHTVTVLNRGVTACELHPDVQRLVADRTDPESMQAALAGKDWDAVFDVSGFVMAAGGADADSLIQLLKGRVGRYVYTSSIMAYEQGRGLFPWREEDPVSPQGPRTYGGFKVLMENTLLTHHRQSGFPATIVRPAAIYGPDNNIFDMETPMFLRLEQGRPILIPHQGLVTMSYGHVDDLCSAMLVCAQHPAAPGQVFNISAEAVTAREYVMQLAQIVGKAPHLVWLPDHWLDRMQRPAFGHLFSAEHHGMLSITKARDLLGITPGYSFRAGHEQTYQWYREQGWQGRTEPLMDAVWRSTWDFSYEADVAAQLHVEEPADGE